MIPPLLIKKLWPLIKPLLVVGFIAIAIWHYYNLHNTIETLQKDNTNLKVNIETQKDTITELETNIKKVKNANKRVISMERIIREQQNKLKENLNNVVSPLEVNELQKRVRGQNEYRLKCLEAVAGNYKLSCNDLLQSESNRD